MHEVANTADPNCFPPQPAPDGIHLSRTRRVPYVIGWVPYVQDDHKEVKQFIFQLPLETLDELRGEAMRQRVLDELPHIPPDKVNLNTLKHYKDQARKTKRRRIS